MLSLQVSSCAVLFFKKNIIKCTGNILPNFCGGISVSKPQCVPFKTRQNAAEYHSTSKSYRKYLRDQQQVLSKYRKIQIFNLSLVNHKIVMTSPSPNFNQVGVDIAIDGGLTTEGLDYLVQNFSSVLYICNDGADVGCVSLPLMQIFLLFLLKSIKIDALFLMIQYISVY